ncbi:MAG: Trk system potassium transporter TrkA [Gemmatimonadetes bacterium]|nr:Trk system potassium transporter TrkA [Gemmatimonadota bacterium]
MRIVIVGAGQVGFHLAEQLSHQGQDVTVIDSDGEKAEYIRDRLDVLAIEGNGAAVPVLEDAAVGRADLFLAVTNRDEVNIIGSLAADRLGVKRKVARISNPEFFVEKTVMSREQLGIDLMINPERECAWDTLQLLTSEYATELIRFAGGAVVLVGLRVQTGAPVAGRTIRELADELTERRYMTVAISRAGETEIPRGDSRIEAGDQIFLVAPSGELDEIPRLAGYGPYELRRVMIAGGSAEALHLARFLDEKRVACTIIDASRERCVALSAELPHALVLHGDATDADLLEMEGVAGVDGFVAYTDKDETNMLASLLADRTGARKVVSLLHRRQYAPLASRLGVDATVSPRLSAANTILRYVHKANVSSVAALRGVDAEAVEIRIGPRAPALGRPLRDLGLPREGVIGAIVRDRNVIMPRGDDAVQAGDQLVLFAEPDVMPKLERLFA